MAAVGFNIREVLLQAALNGNENDIRKTILLGIEEFHLTLQEIEKIFRTQRCCDTYLIAKTSGFCYVRDVKILLPGEQKEKTYYLFISTKGLDAALKEISEESFSYKHNFEKLNNTGFIVRNYPVGPSKPPTHKEWMEQ